VIKALKPTPEYKLADSDDEEDDAGDSTIETRRSVRWAENQLKSRWFINARERDDFNAKVGKGLIRGEVLDFKNTDDHDISTSAKEISDKTDDKKKKAVKKVADDEAAKAKAEEESKMDPLDKLAKDEEEKDVKAKDDANESIKKQDAETEAKAADAKKDKK